MVLVLLSTSVKIFSVSRMRDIFGRFCVFKFVWVLWVNAGSSLNRPTGPIQSLSRNVCESCIVVPLHVIFYEGLLPSASLSPSKLAHENPLTTDPRHWL